MARFSLPTLTSSPNASCNGSVRATATTGRNQSVQRTFPFVVKNRFRISRWLAMPIPTISTRPVQRSKAPHFSVDETNENERDCLNLSDLETKEAVIRGAKFRAFESSDLASSQYRNARGYVAFHRGKCYRMAITVVTVNAQVFDPPIKELTKRQWAEVNHRLEQARDSFRFLK